MWDCFTVSDSHSDSLIAMQKKANVKSVIKRVEPLNVTQPFS